MLAAPACAIALATACAPPGHAIVAEVYYDAVGDDTGYEFVELFNPTADPVALRGVRIEAGDGAGPGRWTSRWTGGDRDSLAPGGRFVIGGARVVPLPQAIVTLDLQNGPDALRVSWPDGASEVVGWGSLAYPEYSCGAPAPDVPAGSSLARVPDASDLGGNALDFRAAAPSPGRANLAGRDLAIVPGSLRVTPERPTPDVAARLDGLAVNRGAEPIDSAEASFGVEDETIAEGGVEGARRSGRPVHPSAIAPRRRAAEPGARAAVEALAPRARAGGIGTGDTLGFTLDLDPMAAGKHRLWATVRLAGDENQDDDRDSLRVRVGPGPLAVTEIQFHPADGEGEWVEVANRAGVPLDLATFTLSDRGSTRAIPHDGGAALAAESLGVLAQDRAALLAAHPDLDATRVWQASPWAALNNSDDPGGLADAVVLREADGLTSDRVDYRAGGVPTGVPIEWRDGIWQPALDPRGTPLAPPRPLPPVTSRFDLAPRRLRAGGRVRLDWALPWPRARIRVTLYDLEGREIGRLVPELDAAGRGGRDLGLGDTPPGLYWAVLEARPESGAERVTETRPLRLVGPVR